MTSIKDNINIVKEKMAAAALRGKKDPENLLLLAVTKTRTPDEINEAIKAGITDIGENKVQEIMDKFHAVSDVRWHMIGHLQTNKVKYIIDKVSLIHSVDSLKLAYEIDKRAGQNNLTMDILIQVNVADDDSKFGISPDETGAMLRDILEKCKNIRVRGFMSIVPFAENPEEVRGYFRRMFELYEEYRVLDHPGLDFKYLSMGMSNDYQAAVEEGANVIRIGTSIFGERKYNKK